MVVVSASRGWGLNEQAVIVGGMYILKVSGKIGKGGTGGIEEISTVYILAFVMIAKGKRTV